MTGNFDLPGLPDYVAGSNAWLKTQKEKKMSNHHAQTALRYLEKTEAEGPNNYAQCAMTHAQLETAEQMERIANQLEIARAELGAIKSNVASFLDWAKPGLVKVATDAESLFSAIAHRLGL